jgi:superfamily II RNA helicase
MVKKVGPFTDTAPPDYLKSPYKPDDFQLHAFRSIEDGKHVLVTAHTGSGKTLVALYAIARALERGQRVYYTTPIKALSNQKYSELKAFFKDNTVGIRTGDRTQNPDADIIVCTIEIVRNSLLERASFEKFGVIIIDEVHYINDPSRGSVWEETIVLLPDHIQQVMLSATINNPELLATRISTSRGQEVDLIPTTHRVVPLCHHLYNTKIMGNDGVLDIDKFTLLRKEAGGACGRDISPETQLVELVGKIALPTLVFVFNRDKCEYLARRFRGDPLIPDLLTHIEQGQALKLFDDALRPFGDKFAENPQISDLKSFIPYGIAYHHSGLAPILKEVVELLFSKKLIKILIVTETFSVGINMPSRSVVFTALNKFDGVRVRPLRYDEYFQMAGRAGRRGLDTQGDVYIAPLDRTEIALTPHVLVGRPVDISSKFKLDYKFILRQVALREDPAKTVETTLHHQERRGVIEGIRRELAEEEARLERYSDESLMYYNLRSGTMPGGANKIQKQFEKFKKGYNREQLAEFERTYKLIEKNQDRAIHIKALRKTIRDLETETDREVECNLGFLKEVGYVEERALEGEEASGPSQTALGCLAAQINECDPVMLTESIHQGIFDDLDCAETLAVLSCLIVDGEEESLQDVRELSSFLADKLARLKDVETYVNRTRWKHDLENLSLYKINCISTYKWVAGYSFSELGGVAAGTLIYNMLKVRALCQTYERIVDGLERYDLLKAVEGYESQIIRGVVTAESLYCA